MSSIVALNKTGILSLGKSGPIDIVTVQAAVVDADLRITMGAARSSIDLELAGVAMVVDQPARIANAVPISR